MDILNFLRDELIDIIEWTDDAPETICWRYPDEDKAIKNGAQLIVREAQVAQFLYLGEFGDSFGPGKFTLRTDNIPILTRLKSWKYGLESPFKADVYFVNTRLFTGNKWGTSNPIMMRDDDFGIVRARAFGTYDFRVVDPQMFIKEVSGSDHNFRVDEFETTMRSRVVSIFSDALATSEIPVLDVATQYTELGDALLPLINPVMTAKYGLEITTFVVENVSLPTEVEEAIDKRSSMAAVGNLDDYVKFQLGKGMESGGGSGGMATEMAVGLAIAQQIMQKQGQGLLGNVAPGTVPAATTNAAIATAGATDAAAGVASAAGGGSPGLLADVMTPDEVAQALGVTAADVMTIIESGELKSKKIGSAHRVKRSALEAFLAD